MIVGCVFFRKQTWRGLRFFAQRGARLSVFTQRAADKRDFARFRFPPRSVAAREIKLIMAASWQPVARQRCRLQSVFLGAFSPVVATVVIGCRGNALLRSMVVPSTIGLELSRKLFFFNFRFKIVLEICRDVKSFSNTLTVFYFTIKQKKYKGVQFVFISSIFFLVFAV